MDVSLADARLRLAGLIGGGQLLDASREAYEGSVAGLAGAGPARETARLARIRCGPVDDRGDRCWLAIRWEAAGPAGLVVPVLDADISLTPEGPRVTLLSVVGAYRPPLERLSADTDRAVLQLAATAVLRVFIARVAALIIPLEQVPEPQRPGSSHSRYVT